MPRSIGILASLGDVQISRYLANGRVAVTLVCATDGFVLPLSVNVPAATLAEGEFVAGLDAPYDVLAAGCQRGLFVDMGRGVNYGNVSNARVWCLKYEALRVLAQIPRRDEAAVAEATRPRAKRGAIRVTHVEFHRNGSSGTSFHVVRFTMAAGRGKAAVEQVAIVFPERGSLAVLDVATLAEHYDPGAFTDDVRAAVLAYETARTKAPISDQERDELLNGTRPVVEFQSFAAENAAGAKRVEAKQLWRAAFFGAKLDRKGERYALSNTGWAAVVGELAVSDDTLAEVRGDGPHAVIVALNDHGVSIELRCVRAVHYRLHGEELAVCGARVPRPPQKLIDEVGDDDESKTTCPDCIHVNEDARR